MFYIPAYAQARNSFKSQGSTVAYDVGSQSDLDVNPNFEYFEDSSTTVSPYNAVAKSKDRRGRYEVLPDQYIEESAPVAIGNKNCREKNERYAVPGSCDKYIECLVCEYIFWFSKVYI